MRLYLSSYKIGNKSSELPLLVGPNKHVALIPNALDVYEDSQRKTDSINENIQSIVDLGFSAEVLDLRKYFNKNKELETELKKYGMVWVRGGDAFVLRKAMRQSGFDKIIIDMLKKDEIVYGGYSAGIVVAGPSLKGFELVDKGGNLNPNGYENEIIWDGLGLIDYILVPHYKSDHPESYLVDKVVEKLKSEKVKHKTLRDGDVYIVNSNL